MNRVTIFLLLIFITANAYSQGFITAKNIKVDFSGFVRNDFIYDSRRNVDACDQLIDLYPRKPEYDANGEDINAKSSAKMLNTFTRFGTRFSGLEIGDTKISALVEIDFTAGSMIPAVRLRHAYTLFTWQKSKLLFGRTWHPTFVDKVYPFMLNENTGLPYHVFNRSPQLRYTYTITPNIDLMAAAVYQFEYNNYGPEGKNYKYQRDAVVPNLHAQVQYYNTNWVIGAGYDWKSIMPRTYTTGTAGKFVTNERLNTSAAMAYVKFSKEKLVFSTKTMFGQNLSESLMPGGYAVASTNLATGYETYTPLNHWYNWVNIVYGTKWKAGIFAGHLKNFGASQNNVGEIYAMAPDVDTMFKVSGLLSFNYRNFMIGTELAWNTAAYGDIDKNDFAKVKNAQKVTAFKNMIAVAYNF